MPSRSSLAANGAKPVLSETVISALRTGAGFSAVMGEGSDQAVLLETGA